MPRGQPDYGLYAPIDTMGTLSDLGELAARLGSRSIYDRRGNVYYWDDFEGLVSRFQVGASDPGELPVLSSTYCLSGSQSVYLNGNTTGDSTFQSKNGVLNAKRLGLELAIGHRGLGGSHLFEFHYLAQGITLYGAVKLTPNITTPSLIDLKIIDDAGDWVTIAEASYFVALPAGWGHLKLVCDFNTGYYVRLLYDADEYDISATKLKASAEQRSERTLVKIVSTGGGGILIAKLYLEDLILTCLEP